SAISPRRSATRRRCAIRRRRDGSTRAYRTRRARRRGRRMPERGEDVIAASGTGIDRVPAGGRPSGVPTVFLLSPAHCGGKRAAVLTRSRASFDLAVRLRHGGAALGEVFAFMSGL